MQLSDESLRRLVAHLEKFRKALCPVCGMGNWNVSNTVFSLPEYEYKPPYAMPPPPPPFVNPSLGSGLAGLGSPSSQRKIGEGTSQFPPITYGYFATQSQVFPVVPVTCKSCGYVFLFSAVALDVIPR